MSFHPPLYLLPLAFAAALSLLLAAVVGRRPDPLARTFVVLMLGVAAWAIAATFVFGSTSLEALYFWTRMEYVGAVVVPAGWFLLALQYAGYDAWVTRRTIGALSVEPAATLVLVWTNGYHGLVWRDISQTTVSGVSVFERTVGPWYWVNLGYSYVLVLVGLGFFLGVLLGSNPLARRESGVLVVGGAIPLGANVAFNFGINPLPVDLTPFTFAVSGTLFAFALFYFDFLDLEPVARDVLVEEMGNPVVVVNAEGTVVDTNRAAREVLAPDLRPGEAAPPVLADGPGSVRSDVYTTTVGGRSRAYRIQTTPLSDHRDEVAGSLVVMDDVTDLRSHEERLAVLNRVLRHNVRNELTVVLGHLEEIADRLPDDRSVETARKHARRVVDLSEQTRNVIETLDREAGESTQVDAGPVVERVADRFRESHPGIEVERDGEEGQVSVAEDLLDVAITNLVDNAIEHNDADDPTVRIECTVENEHVRVSVADNGPGVPVVERSVLVEGNETPLHHGSGLGLWLVHWIVTTNGGDLRFEENEPRGSVVTVQLARAFDEP